MALGFDDNYTLVCFFTNILYNLTPIAFFIQLKYGVINYERVSLIGILNLYCTCFLYFWVSVFQAGEIQKVNALNFCNLIGAYLGFVYVFLYIYYVYYKNETKAKAVIYMIILIILSGGFVLLSSFVIEEEPNFWSKLFKYFGIIFNVLENLPLGFNIVYIIKNKIGEKFTLFGAFFGLLNTTAWFVWAFQSIFFDKKSTDKPYQTFISNIICILMHITQFVLFFMFKKNDDDNEGEPDDSEEEQHLDEGNKNKDKVNKEGIEIGEESKSKDKDNVMDDFM